MFKLPRRFDELLPAAALEKMLDVLHQPELASSLREALSKVGVKELNPIDKMQEAWRQTRTWLDALTAGTQVGVPPTALNATGQLFRHDLAGLPMAAVVAFAYSRAATCFQSSETAREKAEQACKRCLGAAHVTWLSNVTAAVQLLARQHGITELVIARSDLQRIDGFGDVRMMLELSGVPIREVGAANASTEQDWTAALRGKEQAVLLVSPNGLNVAQAGDQTRLAIEAATQVDTLVMELLVDGVSSPRLSDAFGMPSVQQRFETGVDIVLLPSQFFIGGPQALVLASRTVDFGQVQREALASGMAVTGAALAAVVTAMQLENLSDEIETAATAALFTSTENLQDRARRLAVQLDGLPAVERAVAVERQVALGPPPWDRYRLVNWAVELAPRQSEKQLLSELSGSADRPTIISVSRQGQVLLDLRFVPPSHDHEIVRCLRGRESSESPESHSTPSSEAQEDVSPPSPNA